MELNTLIICLRSREKIKGSHGTVNKCADHVSETTRYSSNEHNTAAKKLQNKKCLKKTNKKLTIF